MKDVMSRITELENTLHRVMRRLSIMEDKREVDRQVMIIDNDGDVDADPPTTGLQDCIDLLTGVKR